MATTKRFSFIHSATGMTAYAIVLQVVTGYYLDDADGTFGAAPADKFQEVTEDIGIPGRYAYAEDRTAWADGIYEIYCYRQTGVSPNLSVDIPVASTSFSLIGDNIPTFSSPIGGSFTLAQLVAKWRQRLDDVTTTPPLWSNDEITEYADYIQKIICAEMEILEDRTTYGVCEYPLVQGDGLLAVSPRITRITAAHIDGEDNFLRVETADDMDAYYGPTWRLSSQAEDKQTTLVSEGFGQNYVYIYPPLTAATKTLKLNVYRLPLVDLDYSSHSGQSLETDKYVHLFVNGIMWQAYLKQDSDTYDPKKAEQHRVLWEGKDGSGGDKEKIRRMVMFGRSKVGYKTPYPYRALM